MSEVRRVPSLFAGIPEVERAIERHEAWLASLSDEARAAFDRAEQDIIDLAIHGNRYETADGERIDPERVQRP